MIEAKSPSQVIDLWPKRAALARDLTEVGYPTAPGQVRLWAHRESIPQAAFPALVRAARSRGFSGINQRLLRRLARDQIPEGKPDSAPGPAASGDQSHGGT